MALDIVSGWRSIRRVRRTLLAGAVTLTLLTGTALPDVKAEQESPYRVSEFPVRVAAALQSYPVVSGKWVLWLDDGRVMESSASKKITGRNLDTGLDFAMATDGLVQGPVDASGDTVVALEWSDGAGYAINGYKLPDGQRFAIAPYKGGSTFTRGWPRTDGKTVVWAEGSFDDTNVYAYNLAAQRPITVSSRPSRQEYPVVSGNFVVWLDSRNTPPDTSSRDVYGYDLSSGQEFRITAKPEYISAPAVSGNIVVWSVQQDSTSYLKGYDIAKKQEFTIAQMPAYGSITSTAVNGDLVVWSARGEMDGDIFGYDLKEGKQFTISRAIGSQGSPRVSGKTVVWVDGRNGGVGKYEYDSDIYGARLEPGPAPVPPVIGAPSAVDGKIEIVWPHGGRPVTEADKANIGAWLFLSGTSKLAPCQWSPQVQLWKAVNSEPAKPVATGFKEGGHYYVNDRAVPTWDFNDVDVSAARDPNSRIFLFTRIDGVSSHTNVWAHAADARTYFPQQDTPSGLAPVSGAVDAKIEIVWPLDDAPVDQAKQVNISASLLSPGTLQSAPPDWSPTVRLYRSLNNGVGQEVAVGQKRLVRSGDLTYPVWDFNNVDVSAANDPVNKYYFTLAVDGVATYTNVWAHGADARTYFPQVDTPTGDCRGG